MVHNDIRFVLCINFSKAYSLQVNRIVCHFEIRKMVKIPASTTNSLQRPFSGLARIVKRNYLKIYIMIGRRMLEILFFIDMSVS